MCQFDTLREAVCAPETLGPLLDQFWLHPSGLLVTIEVMGLAHLSMTRIAPSETEGGAADWSRPVGIEAPSLARCSEFELGQTCGLLSADIVRRAITVLGGNPEFRLFIHDDRTELRSALRNVREAYMLSTEGLGPSSATLWGRAAASLWKAHGRRFVERSTVADWSPVFENALLTEWRSDVDQFLSDLGVAVSKWDSDASVLRLPERFIEFEKMFCSRQLLRMSPDGAIEVFAGGIWYPWRGLNGDYSTFARDVVYQAQKLSDPSVRWQNFWPASSSAYVDSVVGALKIGAASPHRLTFPLRSSVAGELKKAGSFKLTESIDLPRMIRDEGRSVARLALLCVASGESLTKSLSWAHEKLSVLRAFRNVKEPDSPEHLCRDLLENEEPLAYLVGLIESANERASFLTSAGFIKDVIGVVL